MSENKAVHIGAVCTFDNVKPDKEQALKPLEEATEVFAAWQEVFGHYSWDGELISQLYLDDIINECADVIQAVCNLAAALGVNDLAPYMQACEQRNRERGRIGGDGENKADDPVEIPEQKTCPHCGGSHVITTKVITIGEGKYSEAETELCLTCGRDLVGEQ